MSFDLRQMGDLYTLQTRSGLDALTVNLSRIKLQGLVDLAIRVSCNAMAKGETLTLRDETAFGVQTIAPFLIGWPSMRALAVSALARDCRLESGATIGEMVVTRAEPALALGWQRGSYSQPRTQV